MNASLTFIGEERKHRLQADDPRLADFAVADLDVDDIVEWANCSNKEAKRNRVCFITTLPVLVPMLVWEPDDPFSSMIIEWIDGGEPLVENIAGLLGGVAPETIQYLVEKPLSLLSIQWIGYELDLVSALDSIPADKRPQSQTDWGIFADFQKAILPIQWDASGQFFGKLCSLGYDFARAEIRNLSDGDFDSLGEVSRYIDFLSVWSEAVANQSRHPATNVVPFSLKARHSDRTNENRANAFVNRYFSGLSAIAIFRQALSWRTAYQDAIALAQCATNDPDLVQWPALLRRPLLFEGIQVVSLTAIADAISEGAALKGYMENHIESCTLGDSFLVSLRDQNGHHISTAQINLVFDSGVVLPCGGAHHRPNGEYAYLRESDVLDATLVWLRLPEQQPWLQALVKIHVTKRVAIQAKLNALEPLDFAAACRVARQVIDDYDGALVELSKMCIE